MTSIKKPRNLVNEAQTANRLTIEPRTQTQKDLIKAIKENDQVFAIGPAGTGKTYISTIVACQEYLRHNIRKIIITRPAVYAGGENYGALPGGLNQKVAPWMVPVFEVLEEALGGKKKLEEIVKSGDIEVTLLGLCGEEPSKTPLSLWMRPRIPLQNRWRCL